MAVPEDSFEIGTGLSIDDLVFVGTTSTDPSTGGGFESPIGSVLMHTGNGGFWIKTSAPDTGWEQLESGDEKLGHIVKVDDGEVETIEEGYQLHHCGSFCIDGELILEGELCLT